MVRPIGTAVILPRHTVSGLLIPLFKWNVAAGVAGETRMLVILNVVVKLCRTRACIPRVRLQQVLQQLSESVQAFSTTCCPILGLKLVVWANVTILLIECLLLLFMCKLQCTLLKWVRPEDVLSGRTRQQVVRVHLKRGYDILMILVLRRLRTAIVLWNCRLMLVRQFLLLSLCMSFICTLCILVCSVVFIILGSGVLTEAELCGLRLLTIERRRVVLTMACV